MWLSQVTKSADLSLADSLKVFIDRPSLTWLEQQFAFKNLLNRLPFKAEFHVQKQPKTLMDGFKWKYIDFDYTQRVCLYLDIDVMPCKSLKTPCLQMKDGAIIVHPEGGLRNADYGADFTAEELGRMSKELMGFSAGKFAVTDRKIRSALCKATLDCISKKPDAKYYCVDQPFFNRAVYLLGSVVPLVPTVLRTPVVSTNLANYTREQTYLVDLCGEPGDGDLHVSKMINIVSLFNAGVM